MRFYFENPYKGTLGHPHTTEVREVLWELFLYRVHALYKLEDLVDSYGEWYEDFLDWVVYPRRNLKGFKEYIMETCFEMREWGLVDDDTFSWVTSIRLSIEDRWGDEIYCIGGRNVDFPGLENATKHFRRGYTQSP